MSNSLGGCFWKLEVKVKLVLLMISILLYLVPTAILLYMASEIYFRNKSNTINKVTAFFIVFMAATIFGPFMTSLLPETHFFMLTLYFKYIPSFLLLAGALHFCLKLTSRFDGLSRWRVFFLCYTPAFPVLLLIYPPDWISLSFVNNGVWKNERPDLVLLLSSLPFLCVLPC